MTVDGQVRARLSAALDAATSTDDLDGLRLQVIESRDLYLQGLFGRRWRALSPPSEVQR